MKRSKPAPQFAIRRARSADAAAILEMEKLFPSDRMSPRSVRNFLRSPSARVWIACAMPSTAVGSLILLTRRGSRVARIYSVVVAPSARGFGLGAGLVRTAEVWAGGRKLNKVSLEVRADNHAARALYKGLGYAERRSLPGYYDDGADGLRLDKHLAAPGGH